MSTATDRPAPLQPGATIGIAGGGQLGRMLAIAAGRLGFRTIIFDPDAQCPAAQMANAVTAASFDDEDAIQAFAAACDVATYEFENIPVGFVAAVGAQTPVYPPAMALEIGQDRLVEKGFFAEAGIATAPYRQVDTRQDLAEALDSLGGKGILKTRRLGYDGKGQALLTGPGDIDDAFAAIGGKPAILEGFVDFAFEISVIAARGKDGGFAAFDPPRNTHRDGILWQSAVPAGIDADLAARAIAAARAVTDKLGYVGVIGVEFFVTADGDLLANEFAPRVHNSGHWTEAACAISQFEQHIRAIAGLPLGATGRHSDCVMENLIGDDVLAAGAIAAQPDAVLHLYGKQEIRAGRKMGHVTRLASKTV